MKNISPSSTLHIDLPALLPQGLVEAAKLLLQRSGDTRRLGLNLINQSNTGSTNVERSKAVGSSPITVEAYSSQMADY
jgi:hypothetical protein